MEIISRILHETPHWLALNKPAGLIVERNPFEKPTVEDLVWDYLSSTKTKPFLGIVHRLDRVTSGVLLMAKKKSSLKKLNEQFSRKQVRKTYLAVVENRPEKETAVLKNWLRKDQQNKRALIYRTEKKDAVEVSLEYRLTKENDNGFLLIVQPRTGKFHQIRAQLAAIGCPIVGDTKYGASNSTKSQTIALHAWKLAFRQPESGEALMLDAPLPREEVWATF